MQRYKSIKHRTYKERSLKPTYDIQYTELRYGQYMVTSVLQDQQHMFGVKSLLVDEKEWLMEKELADVMF